MYSFVRIFVLGFCSDSGDRCYVCSIDSGHHHCHLFPPLRSWERFRSAPCVERKLSSALFCISFHFLPLRLSCFCVCRVFPISSFVSPICLQRWPFSRRLTSSRCLAEEGLSTSSSPSRIAWMPSRVESLRSGSTWCSSLCTGWSSGLGADRRLFRSWFSHSVAHCVSFRRAERRGWGADCSKSRRMSSTACLSWRTSFLTHRGFCLGTTTASSARNI